MQPTNTISGVWRQGTEPKVLNLTGTAFMEEAGAHTFHVSGVDDTGAELAFTGSVSALFLRADDTYIAIDGTLNNGAAEVTLVSDCYHVPGRFSVAIYVSDGTVSTCVYAAVGNVYRTSSDVGLDSGTSIPTLAQLEAAYQACVEATADAPFIKVVGTTLDVNAGSGVPTSVPGTTPVITADPGAMYVCTATAVSTLSFTPCSSGLCGVRFVSGTSATVLTLPNTVRMPDWWTGCDTSRTYEIMISDGVFGTVMSWAT